MSVTRDDKSNTCLLPMFLKERKKGGRQTERGRVLFHCSPYSSFGIMDFIPSQVYIYH